MTTTTTTTTTVVTTSGDESQLWGAVGSAGMRARWIAAGFSLVAAGIHFGFAPGHFDEDWRHGLFFVALGWFQLVWAVLIVTRPDRRILWAGIVVSAVTLGVWAVSRTVGLPSFLGGGGREAMTLPDQVCSLLEGVIIVVSAAVLSSPAWVARPVRSRQLSAGMSTGVVAVALIAGSVSLTPRFASQHHGGGVASATNHAGHTNAVAAVATHDHTAGSGATADAAGASTGTVASAAHAHTTSGPWASGESPCELAQAAHPTDQGKDAVVDPTSGHNHDGALAQQPINDTTRQSLVAQQVQARAVVEKYPTVAQATADGYRLSTVYIPCIGAHYTKVSLVASFNPATPSELLYDGTKPDSKILGLSYLLIHPGGAPEGFAGPNDVWHQHSSNGGLCLNSDGVVIGGEQMSKATCEKRGGRKAGLKDVWMVHDWVAPGWECSWGVFAAECPELGGVVGGTSASPLT